MDDVWMDILNEWMVYGWMNILNEWMMYGWMDILNEWMMYGWMVYGWRKGEDV